MPCAPPKTQTLNSSEGGSWKDGCRAIFLFFFFFVTIVYELEHCSIFVEDG